MKIRERSTLPVPTAIPVLCCDAHGRLVSDSEVAIFEQAWVAPGREAVADALASGAQESVSQRSTRVQRSGSFVHRSSL